MVLSQEFKRAMMRAQINLETATIKVMALNGFTYNPATMNFISQISSNQISGGSAAGYTAGGYTITGKAVNRIDGSLRVWWDHDNPSWNSNPGTMTAQMFAWYVDTGTPSTSPIITVMDKGGPQSRTDAAFEILIQPNGLFAL